MRFLVLGGAGYIGSHFVATAQRNGHECIVLDSLERGFADAVSTGARLIKGNILDTNLLERSLRDIRPDVVLHYAALASVPESVSNPALYYLNNVLGTRAVLEAITRTAVCDKLIFSSTCAIFGVPTRVPISEDDPKNPITPYGRSKLMAEFLIEDYARQYGLRTVALRYFNACGADASGDLGEAHQPETHLIPNILKAAQMNVPVRIFGSDFPTNDGTCVRDYLHVSDLAESHLLAAHHLNSCPAGSFLKIHLGTGVGSSNLEILKAAERTLGQDIAYTIEARREGDPPVLVADNRLAQTVLGFTPKHSDLQTIIGSALNWHRRHPNGFSPASENNTS